jgi:hypothetical protein
MLGTNLQSKRDSRNTHGNSAISDDLSGGGTASRLSRAGRSGSRSRHARGLGGTAASSRGGSGSGDGARSHGGHGSGGQSTDGNANGGAELGDSGGELCRDRLVCTPLIVRS